MNPFKDDIGPVLKAYWNKALVWLRRQMQERGGANKKPVAGTLTKRQILLVWGSGIGSMLFSLAAFFPTEAIIRSQLKKAGEKAGFIVTFASVDVNIFTSSEIKGLTIRTGTGTTFIAEEIELDVRPWRPLFTNYSGKFEIKNAQLEFEDFGLRFNANGESTLVGKEAPKGKPQPFEGEFSLELKQLFVPAFPIPGLEQLGGMETKPMVFQSIQITGQRVGDMVNFKKFRLDGDSLKGDVGGSLRVASPFTSSQPNLNLCVKPTAKFYGEMSLAETLLKPNEDKLCQLTLTGTLRSIKSNAKELFMSPDALKGLGGME